jgi:ABC-type sugar transport system ATPase subunit
VTGSISLKRISKIFLLMIINPLHGGTGIEEKFPNSNAGQEKTIFEVKNLSAGKAVKNVSFAVREGEILGIAGF